MQIPCSVVPNNQYDKIKRQRPAAGVEACLYPADYTACMCAHPSTTYCIKAVKAVKPHSRGFYVGRIYQTSVINVARYTLFAAAASAAFRVKSHSL